MPLTSMDVTGFLEEEIRSNVTNPIVRILG
jgi:hypothetical protein